MELIAFCQVKWKQKDFPCSVVITPKLGLTHLSTLSSFTCKQFQLPEKRCADATMLPKKWALDVSQEIAVATLGCG